MVFGFQVVCLLVTLVTVFAYIAHHVYSREHRLLPLFLGVIAVFDFYRIVLMLTGAVGLFAQLENLLILTLTTVISYYAVDYLHIKLPHAIHVGLFLYLIVLLILIFFHFDQPDTYVVAFRFFTISNALFVSAGALYSYETQHFSKRDSITNALMFIAICLPSVVGSTWQVKSTRGHSLLLVVCLASCLIILYLIFAKRLVATSVVMQQNAFANSSVAQFLLDKNLELIDANGMAMDIFLDGKEFCNFEDIHDFFWKHKDMIFVQDGSVGDYVYRDKTYECKERIICQGKRLLGYQLSVADVTAERARLEQLTEESKAAQWQAQMKSHMLATMSHDLRTPVHAIIGASDILMTSHAISARNRAMISYVRGAGNDLLEKIDQILLYSKMEVGRLELEEHAYSMEHLITELMQMLLYNLHGHDVGCRARFATPIPQTVIGDEEHVREILQNVISNAVKFTKSGQIDLTLSCQDLEDDRVRFCCLIEDTGAGMTEEQMAHMFESYRTYTVDGQEGTGLGMTIVKELCKLMQGDCKVESQQGKGTRVEVTFCHRKADEGKIQPGEINHFTLVDRIVNYKDDVCPDYVYPTARVLLADDMVINQQIFRHMIAPWKVQLDIVANGMEAVEAARHEDYDLIFLDYLMPEVNGLEAGAEIRKYSQVPLVLLTASDQEDILRAVKDKGFDAFLGKPIDMFRFKNTLEELLPKEKQTPVVLRDNAGQAHHIEIYARALQTYLDEMEELREELPVYAKEDRELFRAKVHGVKSASRQIRKEYLSEYAEVLEMAAIVGNQKYIDRHIEELLSCMDDALEEVRAELSYMQDALAKTEKESEQKKVMSRDKRQYLWQEIKEAFASYDTGSIERGLETLGQIALPESEQAAYEQTHAYFMDFAYEEGETYLEEFLQELDIESKS